ncbi:MAG TPA: sugar phosphate nucleotidyltransferase [Patescibacteria group bacterium]|nr:sugar phosphate nucleotidyltransferase [Patescibacteria group bacterium]
MRSVEAVVLCGGAGSRMGELTREKQKCLLSVEEKPILGHILDTIQAAFGSARVVLATGYLGEQIKTQFGEQYRNINLEYAHSPISLETRKRLLLAKNSLKGSFLLLHGDMIVDPKHLVRIAESFDSIKGTGATGVMSGASDHKPALTHGLITVENGKAKSLISPPTKEWESNQLRDMQTSFYDIEFLESLEKFQTKVYVSHAISEMIRLGTDFMVERYSEKWFHFAEPKDLEAKIVFSGNTPKT